RRYCTKCRRTTYQKYVNSLRSRLTSRCYWLCQDCGHKEPAKILDQPGPGKPRPPRSPRI
ncbi:MAG: hypothetical protein PHX58_12445, partial [Desulfovibrio sp.]|nr:hypothetical protein [Desulfovibrio sp.]